MYQRLYSIIVLLSLVACNQKEATPLEELGAEGFNVNNVPETINLNSSPIIRPKVQSSSATTYRYKIGPITTNCTIEDNYSAPISIKSFLELDLSIYAQNTPAPNVRLCIVEVAPEGSQQNFFGARSQEILVDRNLPTTILSHPPTEFSNTKTLSTYVISNSSPDLKSYRYKIGLASTTNCSSLAGYSAARLINQPITENTTFATDGQYRLCVLGIDYANNQQSLSTPTIVNWAVDTFAPTAQIINPPMILNDLSGPILNLEVSDLNTHSYRYKIGSAAMNCADPLSYSIAKSVDDYRYITDSVLSLSTNTDQANTKLCLLAIDAAGNQQSVESATEYSWLTNLALPQASISNAPAPITHLKSINSSVTADLSADLTSYRFKLGPAASTDCSSITGYSVARLINQPIEESSYYSIEGEYRLCVLGIDFVNNQQSLASPTIINWVIDSIAPVASLVNPPSTINILVGPLLNLEVADTDTHAYRYKLGAANLDCADPLLYSNAITLASSEFITDSILSLSTNTDQANSKLCLIASDLAGNEQPAVSATEYTWITDLEAPTAALATSIDTSSQNLTLSVTASDPSDLVSYKYFLGVGTPDCSSIGLYNSNLASDPISLDLTSYPSGTDLYLCLIGKDAANNEQALVNATAIAWTLYYTVYGCIDSEALNYNSLANTDDNTCEYIDWTQYPDRTADGPYSNCEQALTSLSLPQALVKITANAELVDVVCRKGINGGAGKGDDSIHYYALIANLSKNENRVWDDITPGQGYLNHTKLSNDVVNDIWNNSSIKRMLVTLSDDSVWGSAVASNWYGGSYQNQYASNCSFQYGATIYGWGQGWYQQDGNVAACLHGNYDNMGRYNYTKNTLFLITSMENYPSYIGCTHSLAQNYDPLAINDDGSCTFVYGCTDSYADNYDSLAAMDDGSCTYGYDWSAVADNTHQGTFNNCEQALTTINQDISLVKLNVNSQDVNVVCRKGVSSDPLDRVFYYALIANIGIGQNQTWSQVPVDTGYLVMTRLDDIIVNEIWNASPIKRMLVTLRDDVLWGSAEANNWFGGSYSSNYASNCDFYEGATIGGAYGDSWYQQGSNYSCLYGNYTNMARQTWPYPEYTLTLFYIASMNATPSYVYGCTEATADNFDPNANIDDDSCQFTNKCTDPVARNYNPLATPAESDGSCTYNNWDNFPDESSAGPFQSCEHALTTMSADKALVRLDISGQQFNVVCRRGMSGGSAGIDQNYYYALIGNVGATYNKAWRFLEAQEEGYLDGTKLPKSKIDLIWTNSPIKRMLITSGDETMWGSADASNWYKGGFNGQYDSVCGFSYGATIEGYGDGWYQQNGGGACLHGRYDSMGRYSLLSKGSSVFYISSMGVP